MEKRFQLFVRRHADGAVTASVLGHPHLASFAEDITDARADLAGVLEKILARDLDGLAHATTWWPRVELRRAELVLRARQHRRLLPVECRVPFAFRLGEHRVEERDTVAALARAGGGIEGAERGVGALRLPQRGIEPQEVRLADEDVGGHGQDCSAASAAARSATGCATAAR